MVILVDPVKVDEDVEDILSTLKSDLIDSEELSFSDEESETSSKKTITFENNLSSLKLLSGMILFGIY